MLEAERDNMHSAPLFYLYEEELKSLPPVLICARINTLASGTQAAAGIFRETNLR
jgi:hypothetical protein